MPREQLARLLEHIAWRASIIAQARDQSHASISPAEHVLPAQSLDDPRDTLWLGLSSRLAGKWPSQHRLGHVRLTVMANGLRCATWHYADALGFGKG